MPFSTGRMQAAARTRAFLTSTVQTRQTATGVWCCAWHSTGTAIPLRRAASKIVVPGGTLSG